MNNFILPEGNDDSKIYDWDTLWEELGSEKFEALRWLSEDEKTGYSEVREFLPLLPVLTVKDSNKFWVSDNILPEEFKGIIFILVFQDTGVRYLVNTEGFSYPRYASVIV